MLHRVAGLRALVLHKVVVHVVRRLGFGVVAQGCTRVQGMDIGTDTGKDVDACLGEILPAPSCFVFTMVLDIVDMFGFVF